MLARHDLQFSQGDKLEYAKLLAAAMSYLILNQRDS